MEERPVGDTVAGVAAHRGWPEKGMVAAAGLVPAEDTETSQVAAGTVVAAAPWETAAWFRS